MLPRFHRFPRFPVSRFTATARQTFGPHLALALATAPFFAMIQYASFVIVKTYHAPQWVPWLMAASHLSNLLALAVSGPVQRTNKITWIVWPNVTASILLAAVYFLKPGVTPSIAPGLLSARVAGPGLAGAFALLVILSQVVRTPIVPAQSVMYRTNYPPSIRSWAISIVFALLMTGVALYSSGVAWLLQRSETWLGPSFAAAGLIGLAGALYFLRLRHTPAGAILCVGDKSSPRLSMMNQIGLLRRDQGFRGFQVSYMLFGAGNIGMMTVFPIFLAQDLSASHEQALLATNIIPTITSVIMLPLWGLLLDRKNPLIIRTWLTAIWALAPAIFAFTHTMPGIYWATFIVGLVQGGGNLIWHLGVNYYARDDDVALYMGVHQMLTGLRGLTVPFLAMPLGHWIGIRHSMLLWVGLMMAGAGVMFLEIRRERRLGVLCSYREREETRRMTGHITPEATASAQK